MPGEVWENSAVNMQLALLDGRNALEFTHTRDGKYHGPTAGYSYVVFRDGAWVLAVQSETPLRW